MLEIYKKTDSIKLNKYFNIDEFHCQCSNLSCFSTILTVSLKQNLEKTRQVFGKPIIITSGNRCQLHNYDLDSMFPSSVSKTSSHIIGDAADIRPQNSDDLQKLYEICLTIFPFVKLYSRHIHVDCRTLKN